MKRFFLYLMLLVTQVTGLTAVHAATKEAYAVLSTDQTTLSFYYDTNKSSRSGTVYTAAYFRKNSTDSWGVYSSNITKAVFDSSFANYTGLTSTANWFYGCSKMTTISGIENLKTQNVTNMSNMFLGCSSLTSLNLSSFNTQNVTYMNSMFYGCSSLTSLNLSSFNTQNVTSMPYMFNGCSSLTSLNLSSFNTQNVTSMPYMFNGCSSLTSLNLSSFNTQNVTNMGSMFFGCSFLTSLNLSSFNTQNVTDMSSMFEGCRSLTSLDLSSFNTQNVTDMRSMFYDCSSLTNLNLSSFNTQNVTDMRWMFDGCSSLTSLNLSSFNTQNVTSMGFMFEYCSSLTSLNLSSFNTQNVTDMGLMFSGCSSLTSLNLSSFNTQNVTSMVSMFDGCSSLTSLNLSSFNTQNVTDMGSMFYECSSLKTIVVGGEWSTTKVIKSGSMFAGCISLVGGDGTKYNSSYIDKAKAYAGQGGYLTLKDAGTKEAYAVLSTDQTTLSFYYDTNKSSRSGTVYTAANFRIFTTDSWGVYSSNITKVLFDSSFANYTGLTRTAYWFSGCSKITTISGIENLKTQNVTDMHFMFNGCSSLTSLNLSSFNTQNVTDMSWMFNGCSSLTSLNLSSFNTQNVTGMNFVFHGCSSLTSLDLSSFNTQNVTDMGLMFSGCSSLKTIVVGGEWSTTNVTYSHEMFSGCTSLVGGDGTKYNLSYMDKTKAYVGQGGYLTLKGAGTKEAYAVLSTDQTTLSFYYDTNKSSRSGTVYTAANFRKSGSSGWSTYDFKITKVVFDSSFANYTGLTSTVCWFYGCSKITTISGIENLKTQNVTDMSYMFRGCSSLTNLNLSSFNTQNVTDMRWMFDGCSSLTSLNLSSFNTQNVTDMSYMFRGCSSLTSLDLSSFNTQNVTDMSLMFLGCSSLTSLNLSSFNTQNVTDMHYMFGGCSSLTSLNLSSFNTQNVTDMSYMFYGCSSLTSLNLSSFNTQNVTDMYYMFYDCSSLKTIVVGGEWSTTKVTSSDKMFSGCTSLVGGDGTKYNSSYIDKTKAYAGQGGYLTLKGAGTGTDTRTYNGRTWMIGNYAPIRYDFESINAAMASSQVKDGDVLLVFFSAVSGDQTVSKSVKIVGQKIYEKGLNSLIENLYIEAPQVTVDYILVNKDIVVRDNDALIEHCRANNILSGLNWECDNATVNSCYVYGNVDDSNGYDWVVTNSYVKKQQIGWTTGYSEYPSDLPMFTDFDRWTQTTVSQGEAVPVNYMIIGIDSPKLVEYFWDTDPGWTKGSPLKNANNNYVANGWEKGFTVSTTGLSAGRHTLVVRVCSNSGYWAVTTKEVTIEQQTVTDPTPVFSLVDFPTSGVNTDYKISFAVAAEGGLIDWVEYYWDNDPGQKNGHCIVDGGHDAGQGITRYNYSIDCGGLTGSHTLCLRAFCGSKSTVVYVKEIKLTAPSIDYINADDLAALKLISDNLGLGGYWNFANNGRYESDFPGVTFLNHRVIEINLANRGLTGTLSTSWMPSLPELTLLNLSRNNIYGDITPLVAKMPKLKTLNVSYNRITQVSGLLPATITTFNAASQMRMANPAVTPSSENFINELVSGSLTPTTAPVGQAVSLALPSLFYYDADKNDNSLRADIQVVDVNKPETVYGIYSYNGANSGWKFTPQQQTSISLEDKKFVALVTRGKWQQWSACPAQLSVLLGDANIDGTVDVLDVQHTLNYILATAQPFNYWAANTYTDQIINVQDIVCTVNIMLGLPNNARRSDRARSLDRRADDAADASCWVYEQNGRIALTSADDIAAIDIEVEGASTDEVSLLLRHKDFSMIGQNTATGSRYVIFSTTGATIPAGTGAAVLALSHSAVPVAIRCADTTAREVKAAIGTPTGISEVRSAADGKTVIETRLAPGVYIVRTIEADGTSKTVKVLKK